MKQFMLAVLLFGLVGLERAQGDLLAYEGFDLTQGENALAGSSGGATSSGWSGIWTNTTVDVTTGLTYGDLVTVEGAARLDTANSGAFRGLATPINSGTTWISFLSVVSNTASYAGVSLISVFNNERLFIGDTGSGGNWGFQSPGLTAAFQSGVSATNISFLVMRVDWNAGVTNNEHAYLWVNPTLGLEPDIAAANVTLTSANLNPVGESMNRVRIQQGGSADNAIIDEIRLGTTWEDVAPVVPEPGTAALISVGLAVLGMRRRWLKPTP